MTYSERQRLHVASSTEYSTFPKNDHTDRLTDCSRPTWPALHSHLHGTSERRTPVRRSLSPSQSTNSSRTKHRVEERCILRCSLSLSTHQRQIYDRDNSVSIDSPLLRERTDAQPTHSPYQRRARPVDALSPTPKGPGPRLLPPLVAATLPLHSPN